MPETADVSTTEPYPSDDRKVVATLEMTLLSDHSLVPRQRGAEGETENGEPFEIGTDWTNTSLIFRFRGRYMSLGPQEFAHACVKAFDELHIPPAPPK